MPSTNSSAKPIVLAYSGGLDTSFLVPWLKDNYGRPIITVTVDTGGIDAAGAKTLRERALALGAIEHHQIDARADYFEQVLRFLVMGNVRRGQLYPLCVGAERVMQAQTIALMARKLGTNSIAHGCTAAGNDQVRFEVALRTLAPELEVIAPVRDKAFKRQEELDYLHDAQPAGAAVRRRVFHQSRPVGRDHRRQGDADLRGQHSRFAPGCSRRTRSRNPKPPAKHTIHFEKGRPVGIDGKTMSAVEVVEQLETLGAPYGIGRGIHLGDTIIGTKGRVAFEAPAAETLLTAHRELEKLVLTPRQQRIKESLAGPYGDWVHEGQLLDPVCRDIEALFLSSQERVTGKVHVLFRPGSLFVEGVESPYSLMAASQGRVRRGRGRMDAAGRAGLFEDRFAHGHVPCACGGARRIRRELECQMRTVVVDKIASVTQACGLGNEVRVATDNIPAEEGVVVVVEILTNKSTYNTLELTSGRMAKVGKGDIVVGALGHRKALFGYSGHVPESVKPGDILQMLNIGGVLGVCDSVNPDKGKPFDCRVHRRRAGFPVPRRAHRRAGARRLPPARLQRDAEHAGRSGGGAGGHLHGSRQDRRRRRHHFAHAPSRPGRGCLQGHGCFPAPRHHGVRRRGRAQHAHLHGLRHRLDHAQGGPGADAHHADRACRQEAGRHRVRARRRVVGHLRRGCHPRAARTSARR